MSAYICGYGWAGPDKSHRYTLKYDSLFFKLTLMLTLDGVSPLNDYFFKTNASLVPE